MRFADLLQRDGETAAALTAAIERGIAAVDAGACHVIDVKILPDYTGLLG